MDCIIVANKQIVLVKNTVYAVYHMIQLQYKVIWLDGIVVDDTLSATEQYCNKKMIAIASNIPNQKYP